VAFEGFRPEALRFLAELGKNNNRDWFQAHRDEYDQFLLEPARDFVEAMGVELEQFARGVHADPRVNGSIMRINRDTRFSRDKRPYKDHLDLWFWQGEGPSRACPGFWFRLTPQKLILGAGKHHFEPDLLDRYREAVADPERGETLQAAVQAVESAGYDIGGRRYKRLPRGYDVPDERADLLLHDSLYAGIEQPVPKEVETSGFPAFCARHYRELAPLQDWLLALSK
jgi:uncharacterized protein (TIGR02453 family)